MTMETILSDIGAFAKHLEIEINIIDGEQFNPILPVLLNTLQTRGVFYPPPNSLVFHPRSIKFGM